MDNNRIALRVCGRYDEALAAAALSPGHLLELNTAGKVRKHSTAGGRIERMVAIEDALQGKTHTQAYAADDIVRFVLAYPGDVVALRLPAAALAVATSDRLISNGDGCVIKMPGSSGKQLYAATAAGAVIQPADTNPTSMGVGYTFPANFLQVGDLVHIVGNVLVPTATNATNTLTVKLMLGAVELATTPALDASANDVAHFDIWLHVRAIGASGSVLAVGAVGFGPEATGTMKPSYAAPATLNTTVANLLDLTLTASAAHADNKAQVTDLVVNSERGVFDHVAVALEDVNNSAGSSEAFIKARML